MRVRGFLGRLRLYAVGWGFSATLAHKPTKGQAGLP